jgi:hypothetical protein
VNVAHFRRLFSNFWVCKTIGSTRRDLEDFSDFALVAMAIGKVSEAISSSIDSKKVPKGSF